MIEPLYRAAARCLEAYIQPNQTHVLTQEDPWLKKMEEFLPLKFAQPDIDESFLWDDIYKTLTFLGYPEGTLNYPKMLEMPPSDPSPLLPRVETLLHQHSLNPSQKLLGEDYWHRAIRTAFTQEILETLPAC